MKKSKVVSIELKKGMNDAIQKEEADGWELVNVIPRVNVISPELFLLHFQHEVSASVSDKETSKEKK